MFSWLREVPPSSGNRAAPFNGRGCERGVQEPGIAMNHKVTKADEKPRIQAAVVVSLAVALGARLLYSRWAIADFWGDAYHHWLISRLTLANNWVYADYKGLETIWPPAYHYLISAAMAALGRYDLVPAHVVNGALGTLACGLVARLAADITHDWRAGLGAGMTLALLPWHIAYSHVNMPEVFAGVLLLCLLLAVRRDQVGPLVCLAFVSTLTRHELTLFMPFLSSWLGYRHRWRAMLGLVMGSALGLGVWSAWSYHVTGDPLAWWVDYRAAAAWDAHFWTQVGARSASLLTLGRMALRAFPLLAVVGLVVAAGVLHPRWRHRFPREVWLLFTLVGVHWVVLGLGFVAGHLPTADPRYVLVSIPVLVGAGAVAIWAISHRKVLLLSTGIYAALLVLSLVRQLPTFRDMPYVLAPERAAGEHLSTVSSGEGSFWVDAPVSIYYSGLPLERFTSSDVLLRDETRRLDYAPSTAISAITAHDIRFVLWEDVPYNYVNLVWPQMSDGASFQQDGYRFDPVFHYSGWELDYGARPTILWQVKRNAGQK